jgi:hypothetical protein
VERALHSSRNLSTLDVLQLSSKDIGCLTQESIPKAAYSGTISIKIYIDGVNSKL